MDIIVATGITLTACIISVTLKKYVPEYATVINITTGSIISFAILSDFTLIINQMKNLFSYVQIPTEYGKILFKSLGICFISQFASDSCKDANEKSMASKIEFAGKVGILITALPLFEKITQTALGFMGVK